MKWFAFTTALLLLIALTSCAPANGTLTVTNARARPMPAGQNGAVYLTIHNADETDDQLLAVRSDAASAAEVHLSKMDDNGVMSMSKQDSLEVPAGEKIIFEPGGLHVMLIGLQQDLVSGETFPLVLTFRQAGEVTLQVEVVASP